MNNPLFRGSATALITPFENGKVDLPALRCQRTTDSEDRF